MEWVETTGRTVEEAKERALDELGVDEVDAEFEVVAEPRAGLFGRMRSEARVRARVMPTAPRSKEDRRDRRRRQSSGSAPSSGTANAAPSGAGASTGAAEKVTADSGAAGGGGPAGGAANAAGERNRGAGRRNRSRGDGRGGSTGPRSGRPDDPANNEQREGADVEVALEEQAKIAEEFLVQLAVEFGLQANVAISQIDEDTIELQLSGSDLGLFIGQKGATLLAIQNLARTVVYNRTGANNGHINVDVGGYRQKRSEALARFAEQVAGQVKQTGDRTALEPMSAVDRKVVHDTIGNIDGVSTVSEGEEPRRRVVVLPSAPSS